MIDRPYIRAWRKTVYNLRVDVVCSKFMVCFVVYRNVGRYENLELVENLFVTINIRTNYREFRG